MMIRRVNEIPERLLEGFAIVAISKSRNPQAQLRFALPLLIFIVPVEALLEGFARKHDLKIAKPSRWRSLKIMR